MKISNLKILTAIITAWFSACAVGPDYVKPEVENSTEFKEALNWKKAEPKDHEILSKWWEVFNDPKLN